MVNSLKANIYFICLLFLIIVFIIIKIPYLGLPYYWDEAWVYGPALRIMEANHLSIMPDALPVSYSRGHPLLFYFLGASWLRFFGTSLLSSHIFALTVSVALLLMVFFFCSKFFSKKIGLIACFILMLQPIFQAQSVLVLPEVMLALFSIMTIYFFLNRNWIGYIIAGSFAMLTKETGIAAIASVGICFLTRSIFVKKDKINFLQFISKSFLIIIPVIIFCIFLIIQKKINGWYFFPEHINLIESEPFLILKNTAKRAIYILINDGRIIPFISIIISAFLYFSKKKFQNNSANIPIIILLIFSILYLFICSVNFYSTRYSLSLVISFVIISAFFIGNLLEKKAHLIFFIICFCCIQIFINISRKSSSDSNLGYVEDIKTNMQMVNYCVENKFQNKNIYANFLIATYLSNSYCGYINEQQKFPLSNFGNNQKSDLYIFSNMELLKNNKAQINFYKKIKSSTNIRLLKRFESKFSWTEIYETIKQ